jgi:hypothetical protein
MTYTLRPKANFSAGKFIAFERGELVRRLEDYREMLAIVKPRLLTGLYELRERGWLWKPLD